MVFDALGSIPPHTNPPPPPNLSTCLNPSLPSNEIANDSSRFTKFFCSIEVTFINSNRFSFLWLPVYYPSLQIGNSLSDLSITPILPSFHKTTFPFPRTLLLIY